jgi:16S rRNA processing protein RimM
LPVWEKPARLVIGRVLGPHGLEGAFRMTILTDFPERLLSLRRVYLGDESTPRRVRHAHLHPPHALLTVAGLTSPEAVVPYQGALVRIDHAQAAPLAPGEYFHWQLLGATVVDEAGATLGILAEIVTTGANDVYVVRRPEGGELLLPAITDVIRQVDTERGVVTVHLLPGLVEATSTGVPATGDRDQGSGIGDQGTRDGNRQDAMDAKTTPENETIV